MIEPDALARWAARRPDAPALEGRERSLTYRELHVAVDRLAGELAALGAHGRETPSDGPPALSGGCLALVLGSRFDTTLLVHSAARAGLAVAPLSPSLTPPEIAAALAALDPAVVVADARTADRVRGGGAGNRTVVLVEGAFLEEDGLPGTGSREPRAGGGEERSGARPSGPGPGDARYVVWTSGSSGRPRGVVLTAKGLGAVVDGSVERLGLGPSDRWLTTLSLAHVGGLATAIRAVRVGSTLVVRDGFDPVELLDLAHQGRVTHASLVPVMLRRVLERGGGAPAPSPLRCFLVGGAHAPPELVREAVDLAYPVALTYGMTETSSQAATARPKTVGTKPDVVGKALPGVEIRIAEDGEIRVRGPSLAVGYLTGARTLASLRLDPDGWLRTGDLGEWDADGDLRVTGRRSARIVTGGVTVDPREVEQVLRAIEGIEDAVVVGIPDEEWGERVSAALVAGGLDPSSPSGPWDREARSRLREIVAREARSRLSSPKRPKRVRFFDALPRTSTGKVDREAVRALLRDEDGSTSRPPLP